jgi:hypothetical protein
MRIGNNNIHLQPSDKELKQSESLIDVIDVVSAGIQVLSESRPYDYRES